MTVGRFLLRFCDQDMEKRRVQYLVVDAPAAPWSDEAINFRAELASKADLATVVRKQPDVPQQMGHHDETESFWDLWLGPLSTEADKLRHSLMERLSPTKHTRHRIGTEPMHI
ncbi:hypothetical protein WJX77_007319 [Trebouxia sp. C0004]